MNREMRRAQLKNLSKKFPGFDISRGILDLPIKNSSETVTVDLMNFDTIYYLSEMSARFTNTRAFYKDDFAKIEDAPEDAKSFLTIRLYKKIITEFTDYVDKIFGEDATKRIFGNKAPMPQAIGEFIQSINPILEALPAFMNDSSFANSSVAEEASANSDVLNDGNDDNILDFTQYGF